MGFMGIIGIGTMLIGFAMAVLGSERQSIELLLLGVATILCAIFIYLMIIVNLLQESAMSQRKEPETTPPDLSPSKG